MELFWKLEEEPLNILGWLLQFQQIQCHYTNLTSVQALKKQDNPQPPKEARMQPFKILIYKDTRMQLLLNKIYKTCKNVEFHIRFISNKHFFLFS